MPLPRQTFESRACWQRQEFSVAVQPVFISPNTRLRADPKHSGFGFEIKITALADPPR
jgi:hypothetical protein